MRTLPITEMVAADGFSLYEGTCRTCSVTVTMRLPVVPQVVPPPSLALAHRCRIPVTSFVAVYIGYEGADTASEGSVHGPSLVCGMSCDSPWGPRCKCGGKCHLHPVEG